MLFASMIGLLIFGCMFSFWLLICKVGDAIVALAVFRYLWRSLLLTCKAWSIFNFCLILMTEAWLESSCYSTIRKNTSFIVLRYNWKPIITDLLDCLNCIYFSSLYFPWEISPVYIRLWNAYSAFCSYHYHKFHPHVYFDIPFPRQTQHPRVGEI